jgi:DNA anti-recombination protein RmuC
MPVVIAAVVALILGAGIGYFIMNRPPAPDYLLRRQAEENLRNDSVLKNQMERDAADRAHQDPALREEIRNEVIRDSGDGLQEKREVVRARLNNTRTELRGAVAETNRGIPDAMLQEAEDRISSTSGDNNTQAANIEVASSLIRNVDRYYLGHNTAT